MFDLHMHIYNELVNTSPHWDSPMAPSSHAPTKHVNISMGDLGKPPSYEGSTNCRLYRMCYQWIQKVKVLATSLFVASKNIDQLLCFFKNLILLDLDICCFDAFDGLHVIGVTKLRWKFKNKSDNDESSVKVVMANKKQTWQSNILEHWLLYRHFDNLC
jgi:hypothetical protein